MTTETTQKTGKTDILKIDFRNIEIEKDFNIRHDYGNIQELADSIAESGQRMPLGGVSIGQGKYKLTDGHRRYNAIKLLIKDGRFNVETDKVVLLPAPKGFSEDDRILDMFITADNKQLNLLEQSELVKRLLNRQWEIKDIAKRIGKPLPFVKNLITLNEAPNQLKNKIRSGHISPSLVMDIMKQETDINNIVILVEGIGNESAKKITKQSIQKAKGIQTSLAYFKTFMSATDDNIKPEKLEAFKLMCDIIEGKYNNLQMEQIFLI